VCTKIYKSVFSKEFSFWSQKRRIQAYLQ